MYRRLVTLALGAMLVLALALPAAAAQTKTQISGVDTLIRQLEQGRTWSLGEVPHVRGWRASTPADATDEESSAYVDGTSIVVANWNLDASGDGTMWGTTDLTLAGTEDGWHETWVAKFDGGVWTGWGVGRGFGALRGMKIRIDVWSTAPGSDAFEGFVR